MFSRLFISEVKGLPLLHFDMQVLHVSKYLEYIFMGILLNADYVVSLVLEIAWD